MTYRLTGGPEWTCPATLDFCSLEGMCNYPGSCPMDSTGNIAIMFRGFIFRKYSRVYVLSLNI